MEIFDGIPGSPGLTGGKILYFEKSREVKKANDFDSAVLIALDTLNLLKEKALKELSEAEAEVFEAYKMLLTDDMLIVPIKELINSGTDEAIAVKSVTDKMAEKLEAGKNEYLRERAADIRYVGEMLIDALEGNSAGFLLPDDNENYIIAAEELTPVDTMLLDHSRLLGIATKKGGSTSHTVILAKSLGIPAIVGIKALDREKINGKAFLDGYEGRLIIAPDEKTEKIYLAKIENEKEFLKKLEAIDRENAKTKDGYDISVCVNIGSPMDLPKGDTHFNGVGLFRSEFLYSEKTTLEKQINAYSSVLEKVYPNEVKIRVLDVGGDKEIPHLNIKKEENPFLGLRGIRLCLKNKEIFKEQIKAILTASDKSVAKIMLPMVTSADEIEESKKVIYEVKEEMGFNKALEIGIMIETPASAVISDVLAKKCDFFSIGTNDLVQYMTASDRGNPDVENVYDPYHPAVLKMIDLVLKNGKDIDVSICGDMAANTDFTEVFIGMGLKKFSVPAPIINRLKYKIASVSFADAQKLAEKVLKAETSSEVKKILTTE